MTKIKKIFYLLFPILCGSIVGLLISKQIDFGVLKKPPLAPPGILFPIIWSILYLLMGISYYLFKKEYSNDTKIESIAYYSQLAINLLWSIFFFIFKWRFFTIFWTILLLASVIYLVYLFYQKKKISAYLNIPYIIWCTFALYLTIGIYILN